MTKQFFKSDPNIGYTVSNVNVGDVVTFEGDDEKFIVTNILPSPFRQETIFFTYDTMDNFIRKINENYDKATSQSIC